MTMLETEAATRTTSTTEAAIAVHEPAHFQLQSRKRVLKPTTTAAYAKDLKSFVAGFGGSIPCDPATLERYIASLRTRVAPTTVHRRVMALRNEHVRLGHPSPTDAPGMRTLLRQLQLGLLPTKPGSLKEPKKQEVRQARPMTRSLLARALDAMGTSALDRRDRCLLLLGFGAALSRSALTSLDVTDIRFTNDVMVVRLTREDDARDLAPRIVTVPITGHELCAASATRLLIERDALDVQGGALFRRCSRSGDPTSDRLHCAWVSVVVKRRLEAVGIDPTHFSALSLRRGRIAELAKGAM